MKKSIWEEESELKGLGILFKWKDIELRAHSFIILKILPEKYEIWWQ